MRKRWYLLYLVVAALMMNCTDRSGTLASGGTPLHADFAQAMREADSLYNYMQFRDAYDLYPAAARTAFRRGRQRQGAAAGGAEQPLHGQRTVWSQGRTDPVAAPVA